MRIANGVKAQAGMILMMVLGAPLLGGAQDGPRQGLPDEVTRQAQSSAPQPVPPKHEIDWRGWKRFVPDVARSQKRIWLFPVSVAKGRHLKPALAVAGITAGLVALDPASGKSFRSTETFTGFNRVFSGPNTALGMGLVPAAFYAVSLARKDTYAQRTFILAGQAVLSSEILTSVMKDTSRRLNPGVVANGDFSDTWFEKRHGSWIRGIGSFPSGHTIAAYSIAGVFARRYPTPRWHRWVGYGLASLVGFSRISLNSHFPSDVFLGAVLGDAIAGDIVRRSR